MEFTCRSASERTRYPSRFPSSLARRMSSGRRGTRRTNYRSRASSRARSLAAPPRARARRRQRDRPRGRQARRARARGRRHRPASRALRPARTPAGLFLRRRRSRPRRDPSACGRESLRMGRWGARRASSWVRGDGRLRSRLDLLPFDCLTLVTGPGGEARPAAMPRSRCRHCACSRLQRRFPARAPCGGHSSGSGPPTGSSCSPVSPSRDARQTALRIRARPAPRRMGAARGLIARLRGVRREHRGWRKRGPRDRGTARHRLRLEPGPG